MSIIEKGRLGGDPIPNFGVWRDTAECNSTSTHDQAQFGLELARSVFGRGYAVVHEPIGERFRKRAPSRIRAWRAPA